jgi:putative multiple sugar transport system ATP-binding protein
VAKILLESEYHQDLSWVKALIMKPTWKRVRFRAVGENGAGKSTLMNVLSGIYPYGSYDGDITYNGETCKFKTIKDSERLGIVIIHQELALVPYLTIAENMFLGNENGRKYAIDWDKTFARADEL